jgi:hypothetical protein
VIEKRELRSQLLVPISMEDLGTDSSIRIPFNNTEWTNVERNRELMFTILILTFSRISLCMYGVVYGVAK